jgi:hypothetical protein
MTKYTVTFEWTTSESGSGKHNLEAPISIQADNLEDARKQAVQKAAPLWSKGAKWIEIKFSDGTTGQVIDAWRLTPP